MPLTQSQSSLSEGLIDGQVVNGWGQKRKFWGEQGDCLETENYQVSVLMTPSKRPCLWHQDSTPGFPSVTERSGLQPITEQVDVTSDMEMCEDAKVETNNNTQTGIPDIDVTHVQQNIHNHESEMLGHSSMDMEDTSGTPAASQSPRSVLDNTTRCNFLGCSGKRPSLVSGRMYCHCSASWRGIYGMDYGYSTDYY